MQTTICLSLGGRGGVGKTLSLVAIADYLRTNNYKIAAVDCDTENAGKSSCFAHWFGGKAACLNLRNPFDCDKLLESSASSDSPYVLADLPANSSGDVAAWFQDVATPETIHAMGLNIIAVGAVAPHPGAAESVVDWMSALGNRATYLVVLNRIAFEAAPRPREDAFHDWFLVRETGMPVQTIEMPYLQSHAMEALVKLGKLPSTSIKAADLPILVRQRVKTWRDKIHSQLDSTALFNHKDSK